MKYAIILHTGSRPPYLFPAATQHASPKFLAKHDQIHIDHSLRPLINCDLEIDSNGNITSFKKAGKVIKLPSTTLTSSSFITSGTPYSSIIARACFADKPVYEFITPRFFQDLKRHGLTKFYEHELNDFGECIQKQFEGAEIIDLGCGLPRESFFTRALAENFGARRYVGVDLTCPNERKTQEFDSRSKFQSYFIQANIFDFIRQIPILQSANNIKHKRIFTATGLERPNPNGEDPFITMIVEALLERMNQGDCILVDGTSSHSLGLSQNQQLTQTATKAVYQDQNSMKLYTKI